MTKFERFVKAKDNEITRFAGIIRDFKIGGKAISFDVAKERAINWLKNFENVGFKDFDLPLQLLSKIEYHTSKEISEKLSFKAEKYLNLPNSYIAPLGEYSESSFRISANHNQNTNFFVSLIDLLDKIPESNENKILLFDDFLNSGGQVITIFKRLLGIEITSDDINDEGDARPELNSIQKSKLIKSEIHIFYYKAFDEGIETLINENKKKLRLNIQIHRHTAANENNGAFGDLDNQNNIANGVQGYLQTDCAFMNKTYGELTNFYKLLKEVGEKLLRKNELHWEEFKYKNRALGYGNMSLLIITEYNIPTITLTSVWQEATINFNGRIINWNALLPRRKKELIGSSSKVLKEKINEISNLDFERKNETVYDAKTKGKTFRKIDEGKNLEEYLIDFEEATGFEDYVVELKDSRYHPVNIIQEISTNLDFWGHGASKWTKQGDLLNKAIERIKINMGSSRFLILDPRSAIGLEDHEDHSLAIDEQIKILKSLLVLKKLSEKHNRYGSEVQIRVYQDLLTIRLAFINQQIVLVGHYNGHTRNSNESPIIVFNSAKRWSFYSVFRALFSQRWETAIDLNKIWDDLIPLYLEHKIDLTLNYDKVWNSY